MTLTPELPWAGVRLAWKVGSYRDSHGAAGRRDAGEYDTYLFGRTHALGETLQLELDAFDVTARIEHGIGAKRPDPSVFNRGRFTLLHHVHAGLRARDAVDVGLHYLTSWNQEEERSRGPFGVPARGIYFRDAAGVDPIPDGRLTVLGADARLELGAFGYVYAGFAHLRAEDALTIAPAIEVIHTGGDGEFGLGITDEYLDATRPTAPPDAASPCRGTIAMTTSDANWANRVGGGGATPVCSAGNGSVNTLLAQYEVGFGKLIERLSGASPFGGERELRLALYGMFNHVRSENVQERNGVRIYNDYRRLKFGGDLSFDLAPAVAVAVRADHVEPNHHLPEQSFSIVSPRLVFRSTFLAQEQIELQYSRYRYARRRCPAGDPLGCVQAASGGSPPDGLGSAPGVTQPLDERGAPVSPPDVDVLKIQASMWW